MTFNGLDQLAETIGLSSNDEKPREIGSVKSAIAGSANKQLIRDISFKARFRYNYGFDDKFYQHCLRYKDRWHDKLFYVDERSIIDQYASEVYDGKHLRKMGKGQLGIGDAKFKNSGRKRLLEQFGIGDELLQVNVKRNSESTTKGLKFASFARTDDIVQRKGLILNAGGHVVAMKWLPQPVVENDREVNGFQYLAVSVVSSTSGDMGDVINNPALSVFQKNPANFLDELSSGIQIWKYNLETHEIVLEKFISTPSIGACSDLAWLPIEITDDSNYLGTLVGSFTDGQIHLFKLHRSRSHEPEYKTLVESSLTYSILLGSKDDVSSEKIGITCFDFLSDDRIIVGTSSGCIAEFILPYIDSRNGTSDISDIFDPSFVFNVAETPIITLTVADSGVNKYFILANSSGSQSLVLEYGNFQQGRIESYPTNTLLKPIYNHNLKIFIVCEGWDNLSYTFLRHPQEKPSSTLKLDGIISSFHLSNMIGHPLILSGNTFGEVHILNFARKILNGSKATNKLLVPLRLWKVDTSVDGKSLDLIADLEVVPTEKTTKLSVTPASVVISSTTWNENVEGSSIYTAGTISGLIILERLDPSYN